MAKHDDEGLVVKFTVEAKALLVLIAITLLKHRPRYRAELNTCH